ncbi:hypothetical protein C0989_011501 [Termitomyces sp. Mn162]|nr:hypothetical protein C0989_011501 [Termitomyces sp. Mn162]
MAKGVVADPSVKAVRSNRSGSSKLAPTSSTLSSRASMLASVVPMLRRHPDDIQKIPLLTLKLSSTSFLDTTVIDDVIHQPLYTIKTVGPTTTIKRADLWDGDTKTAEIRWSRTIPQKGKNISDGVLIQMRGMRWKGSETFLKRGGNGRKFKIPNYAESLKWKQQENLYWCTTAAVKGPIAILDLNFSTPQFRIFETLHEKNDARPMLVHHGVSILLLDYLLITALFLVTNSQQWVQCQVADISTPSPGDATNLPGLANPKAAPGNFSTSNQQWRKIMYGEPIYPNRSSSDSPHSSQSSLEALTPAAISTEQMAQVEYEDHIYQMQRSSSPTPSTSESEGVSEHVYFSPLTTRSPSPASESIFSPVSRSAAPSHTYLDPSYYTDDEDVPPVPLIPAHLNSNSQANHSPQFWPSSSHPTGGSIPRRLPDIPALHPVPPLIPRPRSTPPRSRISPSVHFPSEAASGPSVSRPPRQLPQPPQTSTSHSNDTMPPSGRVRTRTRSASQSHAMHEREKWQPHAAYHQRTLPTPPTSSSQGDVRQTLPRLQPLVSEDGQFIINKEVDDDLEHWVREAERDMPPPAYNSINFSPIMSDPPLQGPVSPAL